MRKIAAAGVVVALWLVGAGAASGDVSLLCNGQACLPMGSWYTSPVSVTWNLNGDHNNGGCAPQDYTTDTNQAYLATQPMTDWPESTYCNDSTSGDLKYYFIQVEISPLTATATPSRPPDSGGWYNHPLAVSFQGSSFSSPNGSASCTPTITYAGPADAAATVMGTCTDAAGKSVTTSYTFAYDATAPTLTATATAGTGNVALSWHTTGDIAPLASVDVVRTTGAGDPRAVYSGTASGYDDTQVTDGTQYTYTLTARDVAGNASVQTVVATPQAPVVRPASSPTVSSPPVLSWRPVPGASYYNVQLYRAGKTKVLSVWPSKARLQLTQTWRYDGRRYTLKPGRYKWYVWPGFGKRKADRYGRMAHSGSFVIAD